MFTLYLCAVCRVSLVNKLIASARVNWWNGVNLISRLKINQILSSRSGPTLNHTCFWYNRTAQSQTNEDITYTDTDSRQQVQDETSRLNSWSHLEILLATTFYFVEELVLFLSIIPLITYDKRHAISIMWGALDEWRMRLHYNFSLSCLSGWSNLNTISHLLVTFIFLLVFTILKTWWQRFVPNLQLYCRIWMKVTLRIID